MSKIFEFKGGSYIDSVGSVIATPGATASFSKRDKGFAADINRISTDGFTFPNNNAINAIGTGVYPFVNIGSSVNGLVAYNTAGEVINGSGQGFSLAVDNTGKLQYAGGAVDVAVSDDVLSSGSSYCIIVTRELSGVTTMYINEIAQANLGADTETISNAGLIYIGNDGSAGRTSKAGIYKFSVFNHSLTASERASLYNDFLNAAPIIQSMEDN